ncbi:MAG: DUF4192 family protein [Mycobacteriales bacterium]
MDSCGEPIRLSLRAPTDVIAAIPYLLGYPPEGSLVALVTVAAGTAGPDRVALLCRFELPTRREVGAVAALLAEALVGQRVTGVVLIAFGAVPARLWPSVLSRLRAEGITVRDAITVDAGRWWSALCNNPACCPPEGTPVLSATEPGGPVRIAAECVAAGLAVANRAPPRSKR